MVKERAAPTAADYLVTALSPALIIGLVASLVFFLVEVVYTGDFKGRMDWTFFFFSVGAVLVARVAIEVDQGRAYVYGAILGAAAFVALLRFVEFTGPLAPFGWLINLGLIGVVLWSANKLTWDCTAIDEDRDASDQSILEASGLQGPEVATAEDELVEVEAVDDTPRKKNRPPSLWQRYQAYRARQAKKPHTPGVWVVYFSLAALPLFGLGQALIPPTDTARRHTTFWLMVVYVGCGLGLLLTTCFLGLRRYLRQRDVPMPAKMTGTWLMVGGGLILLFLTVGALLPRPNSETSLLGKFSVGSKKRDASKYAMGGHNKGQGKGHAGDEKSQAGQGDRTAGGKGKPGQHGSQGQGGEGRQGRNGGGQQSQQNGGQRSQQSQSGQQNDRSQQGGRQTPDPRRNNDPSPQQRKNDQNQSRDENQPGGGNDTRDRDQEKDRDQSDDDSGSSSSGSDEQPKSSNSWEAPAWLDKFLTVLKWLVFALLALAVIVFLLRGGLKWLANFSQWAKDLLAALQAFWARLFGRRPLEPEQPIEESIPEAPRPRPFSAFSNPFDAAGERQPPAELIRYSFSALEAWAFEQDFARRDDETPLEFAARLNRAAPSIGPDAQKLAALYARLAYAQAAGLPSSATATARQFWLALESAAAEAHDARSASLAGAEPAE